MGTHPRNVRESLGKKGGPVYLVVEGLFLVPKMVHQKERVRAVRYISTVVELTILALASSYSMVQNVLKPKIMSTPFVSRT
eukprot:scaffold3471_cov87-Attheya_sp.AAC.1